jgi:hypothetical protein
VIDFIWAVARPNGSNQDVQQVIFLDADRLSLSFIGYRCECCALMSFGRAECHAVAVEYALDHVRLTKYVC